MQAWKPVLVATIGGLTLGLIGGKAADPVMVQRGEDVFGKITQTRVVDPYERPVYEGGPQDLSPSTGRYSYAPHPDDEGLYWRNPRLDRELAQERLRAQIDAELMASDAYWETGSYSPVAVLDASQPVSGVSPPLEATASADRAEEAVNDAAEAATSDAVPQESVQIAQTSEPRRAQGELPAVY